VSRSRTKILRIGITGGIGSGKSLVCSIFSELGFSVLSADDIAKDLMLSDSSLRRKLKSLLGPQTYASDGALNRAYVASRIFTDGSLQRSVNKLVHPKVEAYLERQFREFQRRGKKCAIVEAALIYEAGYDATLDGVIVVDAPVAERIDRISKRDRSSAGEVRKRMKSQWPVREKLKRADYVIRNTGSRLELRKSVQFLAAVLHTISRRP
jgi:dephospho-CoA kinase